LLLCLMLVFGCSKNEKLQRERDDAIMAKEKAETTAYQAVKEANEALEKVEMLEKDLEDLTKKLDQAMDTLASAQNDADRSAAKTRLEQLRKEHAQFQQRAAEAKAAAEKARRMKATN
jgi:flagellar hook-associated protein FlgK